MLVVLVVEGRVELTGLEMRCSRLHNAFHPGIVILRVCIICHAKQNGEKWVFGIRARMQHIDQNVSIIEGGFLHNQAAVQFVQVPPSEKPEAFAADRACEDSPQPAP